MNSEFESDIDICDLMEAIRDNEDCQDISKDVNIFHLKWKLKFTVLRNELTRERHENAELIKLVNKYCIGRDIVSVCFDCCRNVGGDDQTLEDMNRFPCCTDASQYFEIDQWVREFNIDLEALRRDGATPPYEITDPVPIPPE